MSANSPGRKEQARRSASLLKSRLLQDEQEAFAAAIESFASNVAFERAAAVIARSRRRFVLGRGSSQGYSTALALALKTRFSQVFPVASPGIDHLDLLSDIRSGDVLIAICNRPYRRDTVSLGKLYVAGGGTLLLVTDSADSPLSAFASEQIIVDNGDQEFGDTAIPIFLAVHLLAELAAASSKGAVRRSQERERLGSLMDLYAPDMRWVGRGPEA
jgi:DNA-binding MurR/RpiR family transcriptional regulator